MTDSISPLCAVPAAALVAVCLTACDASPDGPSDVSVLPDVVPLESGTRIDGYWEDLVPIGSVALRPDGVLAFAQPQDAKILFYDQAGRRIAEYGTRGEGPGEFESISGIGWLGDSLWVGDFRQQRLNWVEFDAEPGVDAEPEFTGDFAYRSIAPIPASETLPAFRITTPRGAYADGSWLMSLGGAQDAPEFDEVEVLARVDTTGGIVRVVAVYPTNSGMVSLSQREGENVVRTIAASAPWTLRSISDHPGVGGSTAIATTTVRPGPVAEVRVLSFDASAGDTVFDVALRLAATEAAGRAADSAVEASIDRMNDLIDDSWPGFAETYRRDVDVPPIYPVVGGLTRGVDGRVWLRLHSMSEAGDSARYLVLDAGGRLEFRTAVPRGEIVVAANTHVWTTETDSLGVGSLVRYELPGAR